VLALTLEHVRQPMVALGGPLPGQAYQCLPQRFSATEGVAG
jgi:hypothetical protein